MVFSDVITPRRKTFHIKVPDEPTCLAGSVDGELVACGFADGSIDVFHCETAERVSTVKFEFPGKVTHIRFTS